MDTGYPRYHLLGESQEDPWGLAAREGLVVLEAQSHRSAQVSQSLREGRPIQQVRAVQQCLRLGPQVGRPGLDHLWHLQDRLDQYFLRGRLIRRPQGCLGGRVGLPSPGHPGLLSVPAVREALEVHVHRPLRQCPERRRAQGDPRSLGHLGRDGNRGAGAAQGSSRARAEESRPRAAVATSAASKSIAS